MSRVGRTIIVVTLILLASACSSTDSGSAPITESGTVTPAGVAQFDSAGENSSVYSPLVIHTVGTVQQVTPDSDHMVELLVANESQQDVPVVFKLKQADGQRWRTSLCVGEQCILGDGSDTSVSDPVVLPSMFEQPFQVHIFVDADAKAGQSTTLELSVEPQVAGMAPQRILINAEVARQ